jgi:uncharacterized membrane protein
MEYESGAVNPANSISEGWELIKNDYWLFFGMTLVMTLIVIAVSTTLNAAVGMLAGVVSGGFRTVSENAPAGINSAALIPQLIAQGFGIITTLATTLISALMICGIYLALSRKARGETPEFGDLFAGVKFFLPCLIVSLITTAIHFVIGVAIMLSALAFGISSLTPEVLAPGGKLDPNFLRTLIFAFVVIGIFYLIFSFILGALIFFVYQLIADRNLSAMNALNLSVRAGLSNFFGITGLFIVQGLIMFGGALLCIIGMFFVLPIIFASNYTVYLRVFGKPTPVFNNSPPPPPNFGNQSNSEFSPNQS